MKTPKGKRVVLGEGSVFKDADGMKVLDVMYFPYIGVDAVKGVRVGGNYRLILEPARPKSRKS